MGIFYVECPCFAFLDRACFRLNSLFTKKLRTNSEIRALTVRLIGAEAEQLGVMPIEKALTLAEEANLDLVEVSPKIMPPVCKIMDYGKHLYKLQKQDKQQKKGQHKTEVKGVRLGFNTGEHDMEIKANQARKFISQRNLIKVSLILRGRELGYKDLAMKKIEEFGKKLSDVADIDTPAKPAGYQITMILKPKN